MLNLFGSLSIQLISILSMVYFLISITSNNNNNSLNINDNEVKPIGYNLTNNEGITFTLKNGSHLNYPNEGELFRFVQP